MTTDEKLEKWQELGNTYVSKFRGVEDHGDTVDLVDELLTWSDTADITNQGIVMAWEGVGRRVLTLIDDEPEGELIKHVTMLKVLLGEPDVEIPSLTIAIDLENVQLSAGLDPLSADSYLITITDSEGVEVISEEVPHSVTVSEDTDEE